jgi:hypothetical protein
MSAGNYPEACAKLEESHRVDPAPGTLLNLADCYEHIGRTATAWELFLDVATLAQGAGRAQHETMARARAAALEPKLSKMRVVTSDAPAGFAVHRDGIVLSPSEWGSALPVDPGQHLIEASAPNKRDVRILRYVPPGGVVVTVEVPRLIDGTPPPPADRARAAPRPPPGPGAWRRPAGYVTTGLGLAALGAGTYFFSDYTFRIDNPNGNYDWEKGAAYVALGGGALLLSAGLYLLLSAADAPKRAAVASAPPPARAAGPSAGGVRSR